MGLRWTRFFGRISKTLTSVGASGRQMAASAPREALKSASARAGRRQSPDTTSHCRKCRRPRLQPQPPLPLTPPVHQQQPHNSFFFNRVASISLPRTTLSRPTAGRCRFQLGFYRFLRVVKTETVARYGSQKKKTSIEFGIQSSSGTDLFEKPSPSSFESVRNENQVRTICHRHDILIRFRFNPFYE